MELRKRPSRVRKLAEREWEKVWSDSKTSNMSAVAKRKSRSRSVYTQRFGAISIPAFELLNELPVRVRKEVEAIRDCCPAFPLDDQVDDDVDHYISTPNVRKHQLFSNDHAENLDPEIRQWLPRIVCPAFPLSFGCLGGGQRGDSILRHIKICKSFQTYFPDEHRKLFPSPKDPRLRPDHEYKLLKMTFGQLEFLTEQLEKKAKVGEHGVINTSVARVKRILQSWRPITRCDAESVPPSDFPPFRMPQYFVAVGACVRDESERDGSAGYDADLDTNPPSTVRALLPLGDEDTQDMRQLVYPELYLPPHLLHPTCGPKYVAAAVTAHTPPVEFSPLLNVPLSSFPASGHL
ncbi:hypothetical protein B0F90DRAFT_1820137 [Multifurca ochricompacta]|uniref:Uncharacterized protein n=1 Tax=Multifurca ochricompacta TaxID=376703 RepID=A0AAD4LZY6_9AGAM|nr:hypothetical protein B0F90DRAFT_1820137 [Multifurca ochricompacta]